MMKEHSVTGTFSWWLGSAVLVPHIILVLMGKVDLSVTDMGMGMALWVLAQIEVNGKYLSDLRYIAIRERG